MFETKYKNLKQRIFQFFLPLNPLKYFTLFQQQFITISPMQQIPILINRKGSNAQAQAFKILPLQKNVKIAHRRQKTFDSIEKPIYEQRKHDTLDPKKLNSEYRYRRISSSGGTHKFPKDFFNNNDLPKTPIKIRFSRSKKQSMLDSNTPTKLFQDDSQVSKLRQPHMRYTLQSPERNCQAIRQAETPKFNQKSDCDQQFFEAKSKTTNKKIKLEDYLSHKKESFPVFFKHNKDFQEDENRKIGEFQSNEFIQNKPITQALKNENINMLETLGQNVNLMKKKSSEGQKLRKRNISMMEKENREQMIVGHKKTQKSIKAFLSTKGFNWKILHKISQLKPKQQDPCIITFNLKETKGNKSGKEPLTFRQKKGLSELIENEQKNTFRIRKYH